VLGIVLGVTLVLAVFSSVIFTEVFADSLIINFDKQFYDLGDSLTVSGEVIEVGMPSIAMSIYNPDGKILSANNLEISSEKTFSKTILLETPFYEKTGEYLVKFDYGAISENHYFTVQGAYSEPEVLIEEILSPEIILLYTEQKQYTDDDFVKITGQVSTITSPTVLIGIYDPFGMPAGFYFGTIDSNLEFTTSFLVKEGVNFRVDGTYSVKAHYDESEATSFFEYSKLLQIPVVDDIVDDTVTDETVVKETVVKETATDETEKENNLSVDDIELGKLLNQIKLDCDSSTYADTISYYDGMGPALYRLCQFDSSLDFFNESLTKNPNDVDILINKGSALGKLGYFSEAIVYYDHALRLNPDSLSAKNNKANALANLGDFKDAILLYDEVLEQNPNYLTARANLEIVLSSNIDVSGNNSEFGTENISNQKSLESEKIFLENSEKQNSSNFFDEIGNLFSTLSSLFGLQN
jgi:tetratricopeptide (TPR) repeat protein